MDGSGMLVKPGAVTQRPRAKTPLETFGYRLTIENFRFTKVQRNDLSDGSHYIQDGGLSAEIGDWTACINHNSGICVNYYPQDPSGLPYNQTYPLNDGTLFLLDCGKNQPTSFFQPANYRPTLRQHFGINQIYCAGADGVYDLNWDTALDSTHQIVNWVFSDGKIEFSPNVDSPRDRQLYHTTYEDFSATVTDATWTILVDVERNNRTDEDEEEDEDICAELTWSTQLYVNSIGDIPAIIPALNQALTNLRQKDFLQILDGII